MLVPAEWTEADRKEYRRIAIRRVNEHLATFTFCAVGIDLFSKLKTSKKKAETTTTGLPLPLQLSFS